VRTHRDHPALVCWTGKELVGDLVKAPALCAARLEAVSSGVSVDLTFAAGDRIAVVPCILVHGAELEQRENSPFVWPHAVAGLLDFRVAERIERLLLPWIESLTLGRQFTGETIRVFGDAAHSSVVETARAARFLGAAPYEGVLTDAAPYVYSARFADERFVHIRDAYGSLGAVMLNRYATAVRADLQTPEMNALARRWYGVDIFRATQDDRCDVSIAAASHHACGASVRISLDAQVGEHVVDVAQPIPRIVTFSFDHDETPVVRRFAVECDAPQSLRPEGVMRIEPVGGSSGRILLVLREDWRTNRDADGDDARVLARLLQDEGFHADVRGASEAFDIRSYDLVHAFAAVNAGQLLAPLGASRDAGVPVVLTPSLVDVCAQGAWGTRIVPSLLQMCHDETDLCEYLEMLRLRRLEAAGVSPRRQEPFPGYEAALKELLERVDALIVSGPAEEAFLRGLGCKAPAVYGSPHLDTTQSAERAASVAGTGQFVLVHAPVESRNNQYLVVRAAAQAGLPLVLAGPIVDIPYYHRLLTIAGERVVFIPEVDAAMAKALYRSARVYADAAWISYGLSRVAQACAEGCALVLAQESRAADIWGSSAWVADPCSADSIAVALGDAWMHGARPAAWQQPHEALRATVQAYAAAQQARVHA